MGRKGTEKGKVNESQKGQVRLLDEEKVEKAKKKKWEEPENINKGKGNMRKKGN